MYDRESDIAVLSQLLREKASREYIFSLTLHVLFRLCPGAHKGLVAASKRTEEYYKTKDGKINRG